MSPPETMAALVSDTTYEYNVEMKSLKQSMVICLVFLQKAFSSDSDMFFQLSFTQLD